MNYQLIPLPLNFYRVRYSFQVTVNMARPTFKGYMDNILIKTGKTSEDFWKLATEEGFCQARQACTKAFRDAGLAQIKRDWIRACARKLHHTVSAIACK